MQLNLQKILGNDEFANIVDKLNTNFEQIVLNGGGPQGQKGIVGPPGIPGRQGIQGNQGLQGQKGKSIYATNFIYGSTDLSGNLDNYNANNYLFGNSYNAVDGETFVTSKMVV